ncbi:lysosomal alpha-glucosidase-like [Mytilus galloprovincialis]|uniref:lysosomal alpha-glucosidase-like n=1 Tax=Mytilus galloprovincialis TaxID=29158 RepID=UPI003F7C11D0
MKITNQMHGLGFKMLSIASLLCIIFILRAASQDVCDTTDQASREDCHPEPNAAETTCRARGCCWHKVDQLGIPWCFRPQSRSASCGIPDIARGDCHPEQGASPTTCAARGCCWMSSSAAGASWCFYPAADKGYTLGNITETSLGKSASLSKALSSSSLPFPKPLSKLKVDVQEETETRIRVKIYDPASQRYEVPIDTPKVLSKASSTFYNYTIVGNPYVGLKVSRKSSSSVVFDSTVAPMTFTDQYMEITVAVPTSNLYGLGERTGSLKLKPEDGPKVTFWARDQPPDPDKNLYGSHPFLLGIESDGKAFGIFLLNSNAMGKTHIFQTLMRIRGKRSLMISRSTFAGSGKYTGHWTGDNHSTWADLIYSISGIINFNMFGIPMVGADICGFAGTVDVELCTRWMQLGSFYPFMRNHRDRDGDGQDPASSLFTSTLPIMKKALEQRYRLLPYLYTLFYRSHIDGKPVIRPLFFQFPQDPKTYDIDKQFLWGSGLLISPVLVKGATTVTAYLPAGNWFDIETGVESMGGTHVFDAPLSKINAHIRGGVIIPTQDHDVTTTRSRVKDFTLLVALSTIGLASGELFWDNGESYGTTGGQNNNFIEFKAKNARLTSTVVLYDYAVKMTLGSVIIYGVHSRPTIANFNGHHVPFTYDSNAKVLRFQNLNGDLLKSLTFTWS